MNHSSTPPGEERQGERKRKHDNEKKRKYNAASLSKPDCIELMEENQSLRRAQVFSFIEEMSYYELLIVFNWM